MSTSTPRVDPLKFLTDELDGLKAQGLYRALRVLDGEQKAHTTVDGRSVVNLSSNNYLGLTLTVTATSRAQLDALYQALTSHPMVKVVL